MHSILLAIATKPDKLFLILYATHVKAKQKGSGMTDEVVIGQRFIVLFTACLYHY